MDNLYREELLDEYRHPFHFEKPSNYSARSKSYNPFCGDNIEVYLTIKKNTIKSAYFQGSGCVISIVSASKLMAFIENKKIHEANKIGKEKVLTLLGISLTPTRLKCALLPLEVIQKTLSQIQLSHFDD